MQVILRASAGIDYNEFFQFLCLIALPRLREFELLTIGKKSQDNSDACFLTLKHHIAKALSSKTLNFFGHEWPEMSRDEINSESEVLTRCSASLTAKDDLATIHDRCLPNCDKFGVEPTQTALGVPPLGLFHTLPVSMQEVLKQMVQPSCPNYAHSFSRVTFRAFELHHIWLVMKELLERYNYVSGTCT